MNSQPLTDKDIGFVGVSEPIEKGPATIRGRSHPVNNKVGFQIDAWPSLVENSQTVI